MSERARGHIGRTINSISELRLSEHTLDSVFSSISMLGVQTLKGWDAAAGSLAKGKELATFGTTHERVNTVDQAQYDAGNGPCVDAAASGDLQYFDGQNIPPQWRTFAQTAASEGVYSVVSFPLKVDDQVIGALNFYSGERDALVLGQEEEGLLFAAHAAVAVSNATELIDAKTHVEQLEEGLETRTMIGQATGLLMAHEGLTSAEAFQKLVQASQVSNVKLRELARRYVEKWETKAK
jgi:transcriptional regulator with GAF, ATPase, and Fis domain